MNHPRLFWMVKGRGPASMEHVCRRDAENEAKRLARLNPGEWFYVLATVKAVRDPTKMLDEVDLENEIPF